MNDKDDEVLECLAKLEGRLGGQKIRAGQARGGLTVTDSGQGLSTWNTDTNLGGQVASQGMSPDYVVAQYYIAGDKQDSE